MLLTPLDVHMAQNSSDLKLVLLRSGAHSTVLLAVAEQTGERVAMKLVPRGAGSSEAQLCSRWAPSGAPWVLSPPGRLFELHVARPSADVQL